MTAGPAPAPDPKRPGEWLAAVACANGCVRLTGHGRTAEEAALALRKAMRRLRWRKVDGADCCARCEDAG